MAKWDEKKQSHQNWLTDIAQAKRNVREFLYQAERSDINPYQCTFPDNIRYYAPAKNLHAAVIDYHDQLRPFRKAVQKRWEDSLITIQTPADTHELALNDLPEWRGRHELITETTTDPITGDDIVEHEYRVWLPWSACALCNSQLNDILDELDLAAELPEVSAADIPTVVPDHVKENAPAYTQT